MLNYQLMGARTRTEEILQFFSTAPVIFAVSILITTLFWTILPASFKINDSSDYRDYYEPVARNILEGRGITFKGEVTTRTPPGFALYLTAVFGVSELLKLPEETVLSIFILLCTGLSSVFLFLVARRVWGPLSAFVCSLAWMTYPLALWLTKQPNNETPFLVFFYGGFSLFWYALLRERQVYLFYFLSGLLIGIAMLIRPIAIGLAVVMSLVVWLVKRDARVRLRAGFVGMVLLGNLVAVLPWEVWVYSKTGDILPLSSQARAHALAKDLEFAGDQTGYRRPGGVPNDVLRLMQDIAARRDQMRSPYGVITVLAVELWNRPVATIKLLAIKITRSWYGTDTRRFEFQIMLLQVPYLVLVLLGTLQAFRLGGLPKNMAISIWLLVLYFWGITLVAFSLVRYMVPVTGLLFVLIPASFPSLTNRGGVAISDEGKWTK